VHVRDVRRNLGAIAAQEGSDNVTCPHGIQPANASCPACRSLQTGQEALRGYDQSAAVSGTPTLRERVADAIAAERAAVVRYLRRLADVAPEWGGAYATGDALNDAATAIELGDHLTP